MKKSTVYTRGGDSGTTSLAGGQRVSKTHLRLEAYGTLDELSSHLGLLLTELTEEQDRERLLCVQQTLFSIGGVLATESETVIRGVVTPEQVSELEHAIDEMDEPLGGWRGFILPGGSRGAAQAHVCRTVCRRLERRMYALIEETELDAVLLQYINRLSDFLFVLAKHINFIQGVEENIWRKR